MYMVCGVLCVCVSPKDSPGTNTEHHGAPSGEHHRGRVTVKRETQRSNPQPGGEAVKGRQRVRQARGGHGATEQQIHWTEGPQRVPYKDSGVGMESRQLSALLSKSSTAEVPESQWLNMVQRQCSNKQDCFFTCRWRLQRNVLTCNQCVTRGRSVAAVLSRLHQHGTVPLAVREKTIFTSFHEKYCNVLPGKKELCRNFKCYVWGFNTWEWDQNLPPLSSFVWGRIISGCL